MMGTYARKTLSRAAAGSVMTSDFFVFINFFLLILKHIWRLWTQLKMFRIKGLVEFACLRYGHEWYLKSCGLLEEAII